MYYNLSGSYAHNLQGCNDAARVYLIGEVKLRNHLNAVRLYLLFLGCWMPQAIGKPLRVSWNFNNHNIMLLTGDLDRFRRYEASIIYKLLTAVTSNDLIYWYGYRWRSFAKHVLNTRRSSKSKIYNSPSVWHRFVSSWTKQYHLTIHRTGILAESTSVISFCLTPPTSSFFHIDRQHSTLTFQRSLFSFPSSWGSFEDSP